MAFSRAAEHTLFTQACDTRNRTATSNSVLNLIYAQRARESHAAFGTMSDSLRILDDGNHIDEVGATPVITNGLTEG
jgi:hypothetical protein